MEPIDMRSEKLAALRERDGGLSARQEELAGTLQRIGQCLEQLEQKLQPVLRDPEPAVASQTLQATPRLPESPLGGFLRGAGGHAAELADRVQELTARVDL